MCAVTVSGIVELALDFSAHASAEVQVVGVVGRSGQRSGISACAYRLEEQGCACYKVRSPRTCHLLSFAPMSPTTGAPFAIRAATESSASPNYGP